MRAWMQAARAAAVVAAAALGMSGAFAELPERLVRLGDGAHLLAEPQAAVGEALQLAGPSGAIELTPLTMGDPQHTPKSVVVSLQLAGDAWAELPNPFEGYTASAAEAKIVGDTALVYGELTMHAGGYVMGVDLDRARAYVQGHGDVRPGISLPDVREQFLKTTNWGWLLAGFGHALAPDNCRLAYERFKPRMAPVTDFPPSVWVADIAQDPPVLHRVFPSTPEEDIAPDGEMVKPFSNLLWSEDSDTLAFLAKMESSPPRRYDPADVRLVTVDLSRGLEAPVSAVYEVALPSVGEIAWESEGVIAVYSFDSVAPNRTAASPMTYLNLRGEKVMLTARSGEDD